MNLVWLISLLLFCEECNALLLDAHFEESLARRYGKGIVQNYTINTESKLAAKELMLAIEEENCEQLEKRLYRFLSKYDEAQDLLVRCQALQNPRARCTYAFELYKWLTLSKEIPSFAKSAYPKEQLQFLKEMLAILEKDETALLDHYPPDSHNHDIRYIYDGGKPKALFKPKNRDNETLFWEISFLLGFNQIAVPASPVIIQNSSGFLHRFVENDVAGERAFDPYLQSWIMRDSFLLSSVAVLTLALKDIHSTNMAYTLSMNGFFALRFFDTTQVFKREFFYRDYKEGFRRLHCPFAWAGWDFPQATMPLTSSELKKMTALANSWSPEDLAAFLKHPLTNFIVTEEEFNQFFDRLALFKQCLTPGSSAYNWLVRFAPLYPAVRKKLKYFFPNRGSSAVSFYFCWNPTLLRSWLPPQKETEFELWIDSFSTYTP